MHRIRWLVVIGLVSVSAFRFATYGQVRGPQEEIARAGLNFPRDHRMHQDDPAMNKHYIEWLYFSGILQDEASGALWGYQITLWQAMLPLVSEDKPLFTYDIALSDLQHSRHLVYRGVPPLLKLKSLGKISQQADTWMYEHPGGLTIRHQETADVWHLAFTSAAADANAGQPPIQITADLVNDKSDYYAHSPDGLIRFGSCTASQEPLDGYTYYYTHPALTTTATITIDQQTIRLHGDTWFDHQWGNFNNCVLKWNWFSLRLDNGDSLMIFQFCDGQGDPLPEQLYLSNIDATSGQQRSWTGSEAVILTPTRTWTDPQTGLAFPLAWEIATPLGRFEIAPAFEDQMMPPLPKPYWEGVIVVRTAGVDGEPIGYGYLEVAR